MINLINKTTFDYKLEKAALLIKKLTGICINDSKKNLLITRLSRVAMRFYGFNSLEPYLDLILNNPTRKDILILIDAITTNKTDFFREPKHYQFLLNSALPDLLSRKPNISIWSAGCSSGQEPYTLSILLTEYKSKNPGFDFIIYATDISIKMLKQAVRAVYPYSEISSIEPKYKKDYFLYKRDGDALFVRPVPEVRQKIVFRRLNLFTEYFPYGKVDIIFCRNVMIYFDPNDRLYLLRKFSDALNLGGYLFIGHSETVPKSLKEFKQVSPTVYQKQE